MIRPGQQMSLTEDVGGGDGGRGGKRGCTGSPLIENMADVRSKLIGPGSLFVYRLPPHRDDGQSVVRGN